MWGATDHYRACALAAFLRSQMSPGYRLRYPAVLLQISYVIRCVEDPKWAGIGPRFATGPGACYRSSSRLYTHGHGECQINRGHSRDTYAVLRHRRELDRTDLRDCRRVRCWVPSIQF